jgi:Virulence factor
MAIYQILYWQEIPSQVKAIDEEDEVNLPLGPRFMERIDDLATERGLQAADDYLAQWNWSEEKERHGSARDVAEAIREELETDANW